MSGDADFNKTSIDLVVKFGGAAITDKLSWETLRSDALHQGAQMLENCQKAGQRVVVVHGAGSFGHHHARQYSINAGFGADKKHTLTGFCRTRQSVTKLNQHVVDHLLSRNVPAVGCSPFPSWETKDKQVCLWPLEPITSVLSSGLVPVLHGDCVLDREQGCCILSGDTIIKILCQNFTVERVVFLTDVSGVFNKPPSEQGAKLLKQVSISSDGHLCDNVQTSSVTHDVTGGILTKLQAAQDIVCQSQGQTRVFICKIGSDESDRLCVDKVSDASQLEATEIVMSTNK